MAKLLVYEKKTCITCQKAKAFLDASGIAYEVRDIVTNPPDETTLNAAIDESNPKASLNTRSTLYKEKNLGKTDLPKKALIQLMLQDPNLIKRPLILKDGQKSPYLGFEPDTLKAFLKNENLLG